MSMTPSDPAPLPRLRPWQADDLPGAYALSQALHWPHRREDWALMARVCQGAVLDDGERVVGTVMSCLQGTHATIGLVIVDDAWQGRGLGRRLMAQALAQIGSRDALLYATVAGEPLYHRLGFVERGRLYQYQGTLAALPAAPVPEGVRLRQARAEDRKALLALDAKASGVERRAVMEAVLEEAGRVMLAERNGEVVASGVLRPFGRGHVLGPLSADTTATAIALAGALLTGMEGAFVRLDMPAGSGLDVWLDGERSGLAKVDSVVRMVKGTLPEMTPGQRIFTLVNQALG